MVGAGDSLRPTYAPPGILMDLRLFTEWWYCQRETYLCEILRSLDWVTKSYGIVSKKSFKKSKKNFFLSFIYHLDDINKYNVL